MKILLFGLFYLIAIPAVFLSPLLVRILIFGINCLIPDPIPYADEMLMGAGVISKMKTIGFIMDHPTLTKWIVILVLIALIALTVMLAIGDIG